MTAAEEDAWYADRRARWKPERVRLLLVAESAPDDGGDLSNRRFFYDDRLTRSDGLFREVVRALYDTPTLVSGDGQKRPWLAQLQSDGVYLIDLATRPVNNHSPQERREVLEARIHETVALARDLRPDGIILVKKNVFELLAVPMRQAALPVLHDAFIPFPGSGQQKRFRESFAGAICQLHGGPLRRNAPLDSPSDSSARPDMR